VNGIKESDWKRLRRLQPIAIERFCQGVLSDVQRACSDAAATAHERYAKVFEIVEARNRTMAEIFDDVRRSNAVFRATLMRSSALITDEEFSEFSEELQDAVHRILSI
jgi:hypothetical protein